MFNSNPHLSDTPHLCLWLELMSCCFGTCLYRGHTIFIVFFFYRTKLIEIGKFEATKDLGQYDIGQVKINHFTIFTSYIDLLYLFVH